MTAEPDVTADHAATTNDIAATAPVRERDLTAERAHLAASRAALRRMRERTEALFATGDTVAGDAYSAETLGRTLARRVAELADRPDTPLFFGRLDHEENSNHGAASYHIGRRHVVDDAGDPMVLDWRAPVSQAFYQASVRQPMNVTRRRRFGYSGGELTSFEDEHLLAGEELGTASRILTEEIERPRVGPMRDIVATIQPDQDELVRAPLAESLCVQGAPGTGKTAVGLHRAAYLLYTYPDRLRNAGVLVVGPSRAFLDYIAAVLPALGEVDVTQVTIDDLVSDVPPRAAEPSEVAELKHDERMAEVVRRALYAQLSEPAEPLVVPDGGTRWRVPVEPLRRVVGEVRDAVTGDGLPYQTGRERLTARLVGLLQRMAEARGESPGEAWQRRMARSRPIKALLDQVWPVVRAETLIARLFSEPVLLATASEGLLAPEEQALLRWDRPRGGKAARWTAADAVLIDEALGLLERLSSYGHVVVDEAQDLSPMQCRAIARRNGHGSLTILGDLAQGTAPWAARRWRDSLRHLGKPGVTVNALTTGFRVPAAVVELANRLLPQLRVDVPEGRSLRHDGQLTVRHGTDLATLAREALAGALRHEGSVAVIATELSLRDLGSKLDDLVGDRVTLLPASLAKGLEYDHVIVVEPAEIVAAEPRGSHRLYVVLTRAVSRLDVLHSEPLPAALTGS
ncbi:MAG TPA: AAA family ATPase [Micromonosporaceae bacterium]|nr:AAA family ATPase [Micromonosporaceae bacterium]